MKLDNRPKKLLVKDVGSDSIQAVRDWYEAGGQVDAVETLDNGDIVVAFRTRAAAEQVRFTKQSSSRLVDH
jgi:RNA-binding protein 26